MHVRATPSSRRTNAAVIARIARSFGRCAMPRTTALAAATEAALARWSGDAHVMGLRESGTASDRRYGTDDGPSQKVVVFLHLLSYVARNADVQYVCSETKSEKSTDHDSFFAKYRIFIGKVPQVHKGTVHHL